MIGLEPWQRDAELLDRANESHLAPPALGELAQWLEEYLGLTGELRWVYARWKPGVSVTTAYSVGPAEASNTVVLKRYAGDKAGHLATREARGSVVLPEERVHLFTVPHDRELPGLERVLDMRRTRRLVDSTGEFQPLQMRPGPSRLEILRYKPERRCVLRLDLRLRPPGPRDDSSRIRERLAVRVLPPAVAAAAARRRRELVASGGGALAPRLIGTEERTGILLEEWLDLPLFDRRAFEHAPAAGRMLRALHDLGGPSDEPERAPAADEDDALFAWDAELSRLARIPRPPRTARTWIHGDFHPEQLAGGRDEWRFLDLDGLDRGEPLRDLASWITDAVEEGQGFGEASRALLAGYGTVSSERDLAAHVAYELRARAAGALRRLQAGARERAKALLERALDLAPAGTPVPGFTAALPGVVERIDELKGERLVVTVRDDGRLRRFACEDEPRELLLEQDGDVPLAASVHDGSDHVLAWRPGRRVVLARGDEVWKGWRARRFAENLERHRIAERTRGFRVPRVTACDEELCALGMERLAGVSILASDDPARHLLATGRALRTFQETPAPTLGSWSASDELENLDKLRERVQKAGIPVPRGWSERRDELAPVASGEAVLTHRDLHDGQLLATREHELALLDFDLLCRSDSVLDVANLAAHLELRRLQRPGHLEDELVRSFGRALLEGFDLASREEAAFDFYLRAARLRLVLVYALRPRWSLVVDELMNSERLA